MILETLPVWFKSRAGYADYYTAPETHWIDLK
jgi:hypothetical protein